MTNLDLLPPRPSHAPWRSVSQGSSGLELAGLVVGASFFPKDLSDAAHTPDHGRDVRARA